MDITFFGPDINFFETAFAGDKLTVGITANYETTYTNDSNGSSFTLTTDSATAINITKIVFQQSGVTVARFDNIFWDLPTFLLAIFNLKNGDPTAVEALFALQPINFDAKTASVGLDNRTLDYTTVITAEGSNFTDILRGGTQNDSINGRGGDDILGGFDGNDKVFGGAGDDALTGGKGKDRLKGGSGDDVILGEKGNDRLYGGSGNEVCLAELAMIKCMATTAPILLSAV